jgi:predicted DNA binding CopG/RHH family protein
MQTPTKTSLPPDYRVACRVPKKLLTRVKKIARDNGMDVSDVVRMSLYRVLPEYEKQEAA